MITFPSKISQTCNKTYSQLSFFFFYTFVNLYFSVVVGNVISSQYLLNLLSDSNKLLAHQDQYKRNVLHYAAMSGSSEVASLYARWCSALIVCMTDFLCMWEKYKKLESS